MNQTKKLFLIILDLLSCGFSWYVFYTFRKLFIENSDLIYTTNFYFGLVLVPFFWIGLFSLQGTYIDVKRLYRMKILKKSFIGILIGAMALFFILLIDDTIPDYRAYYTSFSGLFLIHFTVVFGMRTLFITYQVRRIQQRKEGFNTLMIGEPEKVIHLFNELNQAPKSIGNIIIGYLNFSDYKPLNSSKIPFLGSINNLNTIVKENKIEDIIIASSTSDTKLLSELIAKIAGKGIHIKLLPDMFDLITGHVKSDNIYGTLLVDLPIDEFTPWQKSLKRLIDVLISFSALVLLLPFFILIAVLIKRNSKGPIFYFQERIGKNGRPFEIIKFRTMIVDAEKNGPQLSNTGDQRITSIGVFLRKTRIDEFPQFLNVLKGEMSLVGPRPERQYYINLISQQEPHYLQLTSVTPGITSWGQVKFGYAENVEEMIRRMKYDLVYLKNRSLTLDFKIMFYTIIIILKAKGK
jgi:exopolysaccharide biosynthesis polyprenyl glycosylphosphotransferase